ncbi:MAG: hypothetical protein ACYCUZ_05285 [Cuniculiplasma sp.]
MENSGLATNNKIDVLVILKYLAKENPQFMLEGIDLDISLKKSARLTYWLAIIQLAIADVSILVAAYSSTIASSQSTFNYLIFFLSGFSALFVVCIYVLTRWYGSKDRKGSVFHHHESPVYTRELQVYCCKSCYEQNEYSILELKDLFHKIEYPEHKTNLASIKVNAYKLLKITDFFSIYELGVLFIYYFLLILLQRLLDPKFFSIDFGMTFAPILYILLFSFIRLILRNKNNSNLFFLEIRDDYSKMDTCKQAKYSIYPLIITNRYLRKGRVDSSTFPVLKSSSYSSRVFLSSKIHYSKFRRLQVEPYNGIKPGNYKVD